MLDVTSNRIQNIIKWNIEEYYSRNKKGQMNQGSENDKLASVFSFLKKNTGDSFAQCDSAGTYAGFAGTSNVNIQQQKDRWEQSQREISNSPSYSQAILELLEDCFSVIPSQEPCVSLYQFIRIKVALDCALNISQEQGASLDAPYALYTVDYSGIQSFIYTIVSKGALKALRSRSLYLTVLSEYTADLLLDSCGLTRANLIYSGGGKSHFLLSSAPSVIEKANEAVRRVNKFLQEHFGANLYLASGWAKANGDTFTSYNGKSPALSVLFQNVSRQVSENKLHRYSYTELTEMKNLWAGKEGRECAICGQSNRLRQWHDRELCLTCLQLERFSSALPENASLLCVVEGEIENGLALPSMDDNKVSLVLGNSEMAQTAKRSYSINCREPRLPRTVRINLSRYQALNENGLPKTLEELSASSSGIKRLGVFRGDVDNLGHLFASGFVQDKNDTARPWERCTLSNYAMLSSALTWFFQRHLDDILIHQADIPYLKPIPKDGGVSVVYAGGDDVFLIGAWNDVLNAGLKLQKAFDEFTNGTVTMSAGFGLFTDHTPVISMASSSADLESEAKEMEGKNAIALFGKYYDERHIEHQYRFHWNELRDRILDDKIPILNELFTAFPDKGNSFLYHLLALFRQVDTDPMAISRLAYLLARHTPNEKNGAKKETIEAFQSFTKKAYAWAANPKENLAFQTACLLYTYLHRNTNKEEEE